LLFHLAGARLGFTHVYAATSGIEHHLSEDTLILRSGGAMMAYKSTGQIEPLTAGPGAGIEYRNHGLVQGWAAIVSHSNDLEAFVGQIAASELVLDPDGARLSLRQPDGKAMILDC